MNQGGQTGWAPHFGINLVGHIRGNIGLSVAIRGLAEALLRLEVPFSVLEVEPAYGGTTPIPTMEAHLVRQADQLKYPVNVYVLPLNFQWIFQTAPWLLNQPRLHVGCLWWEVSTFPPALIPFLSQLDAVLANSRFVAGIAANDLPLTPVIEAQQPILLPTAVADRGRFGLPETATVFVTSFDPTSDPARKNPLASLQAFRAAFPRDVTDVCLAVRLNHASASEFGIATVNALRDIAGDDQRIRLLLDPMSYEEVLALYASADVYVSLHRSEGLGLGLMESMYLGRPVIATGWSGNMSFMDYTCACPVRYRLIPAQGNHDFYQADYLGPNAQWADPVIEDATAWMIRLHADADYRRKLGAAAQARIQAYQEQAWSRTWVDALEALWQAQRHLLPVGGKLSGISPPTA